MSPCCRPVARGFLVRVLLTLLCVAVLGGIAYLAHAAEPKADIPALIQQLGHDDFEQRELASRRLADLGEDALAPLKAAVDSGDAEVRRRVDELITTIERRLFGEQAILVGHTSGLWAATFSPDGKRAATSSDDKSLRLWDLESGRELGCITANSAVNCARFFRDGRRLLVGLGDGSLGIHDTSGRLLAAIGKHTDEIVDLEILPGENEAVTVGRDRTLRCWDLRSAKLVRSSKEHTDMIRRVAVSRDGSQAATASFDGSVHLWDLASGELLQTLRPQGGLVFAVGFSPDGKQLVTGTADRLARVWDIASGEEVGRFEGHTGFVYSALFLLDGRRLLTGSEDHTVRLWDLATGRELRVFRGHTDYVRQVELAPDGRRFLSASKDRTARLWNVPRE